MIYISLRPICYESPREDMTFSAKFYIYADDIYEEKLDFLL